MTSGGSASHRIIELSQTGSTNKDAMRLALSGEALPLWVVARLQTSGKGRAGRSWQSLEGNLHASLAVLLQAPLERAGELALVAGIAFYDAVQQTCPLALEAGLRLKWPNDILIGNAKSGGILVESTTARGEPGFLAVIGFGLNVTSVPAGLGRDVSCLKDFCDPPDVIEFVSVLAGAMQRWLAAWDDGRGFTAHIAPAWRARGGAQGEAVTINGAEGPVTGLYRGIDDRGYLIIETPEGARRAFSYGDVLLANETPESRTL
jgi:BirA family biotin operon repressor/biotin-[acetyl-CoA-carboxylase] ligase